MRVKNIKFRTPLDQKMTSVVKFYQKKKKKQQVSPHCTPSHMTDSMTYPHTTSHIFHQHPICFHAFSQQHGAIRRGALRHGAHGHARLRQQEDRGGAWCVGVDNAALAAEAALGWRRGVAQQLATTWCGGWCVRHVFLTCFGVSSVSLVCGSVAVMRSAFVPQRSSTVGFLLTHAAQSPVFANVCRRLASIAAAAASMSTWRRSTGQRNRWYVGKC